MSSDAQPSGPPPGPPLPNPLPPDEDRGPQLIAIWWAWSAISIALVSLRLYARLKLRAVGWDDWMMLFTVVLFVICTCFVTYMSSIGGARHVYYLTPEETLRAVKYSFLSQPWAIFLFAPGKASVALLTLRIIGRSAFWRRYILYFLIISLFIVCSLGCIFTFVQCNPPRAIWTPTLQATAKCWDPNVHLHFNYFLAAWNIMADIVLAGLPATFISGLNLRRNKKIALCVFLSLGVLAAIFSAVKLPYLADLGNKTDFTWKAYNIQVWTGAEAFVMIVCGNVPPLQILWDRFVTHKVDSSYGRTPLKGTGISGGSSNFRSGGGGGGSSNGPTSSSGFKSSWNSSRGNTSTTTTTTTTAVSDLDDTHQFPQMGERGQNHVEVSGMGVGVAAAPAAWEKGGGGGGAISKYSTIEVRTDVYPTRQDRNDFV